MLFYTGRLRWMLFLWALPLDAILQMMLQRAKGITQGRLWDAAAGQSKAS